MDVVITILRFYGLVNSGFREVRRKYYFGRIGKRRCKCFFL